jgi:hypothetical protein
MNREEKEMAVVLGVGVAVTLMAVVCILFFETCIISAIITITAIAAYLWVYVLSKIFSKIFGELLEEVRKQQIHSHNKPKCVTDN